jgi:hypothetical protein
MHAHNPIEAVVHPGCLATVSGSQVLVAHIADNIRGRQNSGPCPYSIVVVVRSGSTEQTVTARTARESMNGGMQAL